MNLIDRLQVSRYARRLQESGAEPAALAAASSRLVQLGAAAVRPLLSALQSQPATEATLETLEQILSEKTLAIFVESLHSGEGAIADAATRALARGRGYDPVEKSWPRITTRSATDCPWPET